MAKCQTERPKSAPPKDYDDRVPDRAAWEQSIKDNAVLYSVSLFLGRGQYAKAEATTIDGILREADNLVAAHPTTTRKPIFYAINATDHSVSIDKVQLLVMKDK